MTWTKRHGIMLCQPLDERNLERNFKLSPILFGQPKLDGIRSWVEWQGNEPVLISSQGNSINCLPHINLAIKEMFQITGDQLQLDGELYAHGFPFEEIVSRAKRDKLHPDYLSVKYHIFDYKAPIIQMERKQILEEDFHLFYANSSPELREVLALVKTTLLQKDDIDNFLTTTISEGYEGIILRNPTAPYVEKRPFTILKWKPSKFDYYKIVAYHEAVSQTGTPKGTLGSLTLTDRYGNHFSAGPGLGLTEEAKQKLWQTKDDLVGRWAKVCYQNLTAQGIPRFGKFTTILLSEENGEEEPWN